MSWEDYVDYLKAGNVVQEAAIFDVTGQVYASSFGLAAGSHLGTNKVTVPDAEDPEKTVELDYDENANLLESKIFNDTSLGVKNQGVSSHAGGVRINNRKYYTVSFDNETGSWYLKKEKGGAAVVRLEKVIIFGSWSSEEKQENEQPQNAAETNKRVEALGALLKSHGY
jgi:profilin